jgi:hypothetical protein
MMLIRPDPNQPTRGAKPGASDFRRLWPLLIVLGLLSPGCGSGNPPAYPVSGTVRFEDGTPVRSGLVEFESVELAINARSEIGPDGSFQLTTWRVGDGAVAGKHRALVLQPLVYAGLSAEGRQEHSGHEDSAELRVAPEMGRYETSQLEFTVQPQPRNEVVIVVRAASPAPPR